LSSQASACRLAVLTFLLKILEWGFGSAPPRRPMCLLPASSLYKSASGHHEPIVEFLDTNTFLEARSQSYVCHEKPMAILTVGAQNKTASCSSHEGVDSTNHTYNTNSPCCMLKFKEAQLNGPILFCNHTADLSSLNAQTNLHNDALNRVTYTCRFAITTIVASYGDAILLRRFSSIYQRCKSDTCQQ
jgi:hypothetical protein